MIVFIYGNMAYGLKLNNTINLSFFQLYAPLNIYLALVGIVVWSEKDEVALSQNGVETLTNFLYASILYYIIL